MPLLVDIFVTLAGACLGSFLNVVIYRLPQSLSIIRPSSFCPACRKPIAALENVPVISYLLLRGRCSGCKAPISVLYPLVEIITAACALGLWLRFGLSLGFFLYLIFSGILIVCSVIDLVHLLIPEILVLPGVALGIALHITEGTVLSSLAGIVLGGGLICLVRIIGGLVYHREVMGFGDVELAGMIGAFLGLKYTFIAILLAALLGALIAGIYLVGTRKERQTPIPFGPFLSLGALLALYVQGLNLPFLSYYL